MARKFLKAALILLLTLQSAGLASCQSLQAASIDPGVPVTLECWHYFGGSRQDSFEKLIATFNETVGQAQGIQVNVSAMGAPDDLAEKVLNAGNAIAGGAELPDVLTLQADAACKLAARNKLAELSQYLSTSQLSEFQSDFLAEGYLLNNASLYMMPLFKSSEVVALNLTAWQAFAAANPKYADPAQVFASWESVSHAAEAYRRWSGGKALVGFDSLANFLIVGSRQLGVDLLHSANGKAGSVKFDREAFHQLWNIYYNNIVLGGFASPDISCSASLKNGSQIAGIVSSESGLDLPVRALSSKKSVRPIELQVLPYPVFTGVSPVCIQQGTGIVVIRSNARKEAAASVLLRWLTLPEQNIDFSLPAGCLPVTRGSLQSQLLRTSLADLARANQETPGISLCLNTLLDEVNQFKFYAPDTFTGREQICSYLARSLAKFADDAHAALQADIKHGLDLETIQDEYINEVVFEEWYSQLIQNVGKLMKQD